MCWSTILKKDAFLGFLHTAVSDVYHDWCIEQNHSISGSPVGENASAGGQRRTATVVSAASMQIWKLLCRRASRSSQLIEPWSGRTMPGSCQPWTQTCGYTGGFSWTSEEWKHVAWPDKSLFLLWHADDRVRICYWPGTSVHIQKAHITSGWFLEHDSDFTLLQWWCAASSFQTNRGPFGWCGTGCLQHQCHAEKSPGTAWGYWVSTDRNL